MRRLGPVWLDSMTVHVCFDDIVIKQEIKRLALIGRAFGHRYMAELACWEGYPITYPLTALWLMSVLTTIPSIKSLRYH